MVDVAMIAAAVFSGVLLGASPPEPADEQGHPLYDLKRPIGLDSERPRHPLDLRRPSRLEDSQAPTESEWVRRYEKRSRRMFIATGVLFGLASVGEKIGAGIAASCSFARPCAIGLTYTWGSDAAGIRYALFTTGPASAYVAARVVAVPLVWVGEGLLLSAAYDRALADVVSNRSLPHSRKLAWALFGSGLGLYLASRIIRLGFALGGVCQDMRCVLSFDQFTLSSSRALAFTGSASLIYQRTQANVRIGLAPTGALGLGVQGEF